MQNNYRHKSILFIARCIKKMHEREAFQKQDT